jgi:hypothetical protein
MLEELQRSQASPPATGSRLGLVPCSLSLTCRCSTGVHKPSTLSRDKAHSMPFHTRGSDHGASRCAEASLRFDIQRPPSWIQLKCSCQSRASQEERWGCTWSSAKARYGGNQAVFDWGELTDYDGHARVKLELSSPAQSRVCNRHQSRCSRRKLSSHYSGESVLDTLYNGIVLPSLKGPPTTSTSSQILGFSPVSAWLGSANLDVPVSKGFSTGRPSSLARPLLLRVMKKAHIWWSVHHGIRRRTSRLSFQHAPNMCLAWLPSRKIKEAW